jgi:hypothetical protein
MAMENWRSANISVHNTHILRKTTDMIITAFPEPWPVGWNPILNQIQRAESIAPPDDMIARLFDTSFDG